jgi:hypothetical protein
MRSRMFGVAAVLAACLVPLVARAELVPRTSLDTLLFAAPDPAALRARLAAFGDSLAAPNKALAARAWAHRADSFARDGEPDSAVTSAERALAIDARAEWRLRVADALIARLDPGDAARAIEVLRPIQPNLPQLPDMEDTPAQSRFAWAQYLTGHADSAAALFAPLDPRISPEPEWRYRLACVAVERAEWARALALLTPLAVRSRQQDSDVMDMIRHTADALNAGTRIVPMLDREIAARDGVERDLLTDLSARRVAFLADDGFRLSGVVIPATGVRAPPAVIIASPHDTLASYDALALGLAHMGMPVMLFEPRGSGLSIGPTCPSHESWRGREVEMQSRVARDVHRAFQALARETRSDSSRYLLVATGDMAPVAVEAAGLDPRAQVLLLVSPAPHAVDRGAMRANLARLRRPVYFQTGPEDFSTYDVTDALYRACNQRVSRVAESERAGHEATLFRQDTTLLTRFKTWLAESWPRAPRATPHAAPPRR